MNKNLPFLKFLGFIIGLFFLQVSYATTCANAIVISPASLPITNQSLVCGAANDLSATSVPTVCGAASNSYKGGLEALYSLNPTTTGSYTISIAGQTWTGIYVYNGCPNSGGICVNSIGSSATTKSLTVTLTAGNTYYIWFDTWPSPASPCPGTFSITAPPAACTGQPTGGTTASSANPACSGTNFTLSLTGATTGTGITYQWQSADDMAFTAGVTNLGTASTQVTSQTAAKYYRCQVTCTTSSLSAYSAVLYVTMNTPQNCYCTAVPAFTADEEIYSVTVNGASNALGCGVAAPGAGSVAYRYSNFTGFSLTSFEAGATGISFTVEENECDGTTYYSFGTGIWIDWNQDGDFVDLNEEVFKESAILIGPRNVTGSFNVPVDALTGPTRMRIIVAENFAGATLTPCLVYNYGETEDYIVTITAPMSCSGTPAPGNTNASTTTVCSGGTTLLSLQNGTSGTGVNYNWQSGPSNSGPWTSTGGTASTYTPTVNSDTWYQCVVTCTASGQSGTSNPVLISIVSGAGTAAINPATQLVQGCGSGSTQLSITGTPPGATFQWKFATVSGGPYTNISGATLATVNIINIPSDLYFACDVTSCSSTSTSNEVFFDITTGWNITNNFYSGGAVTIPSTGNSTPYPSDVTVSGLTGTVQKVVVQICGATHTWPLDVNMALRAPSGEIFVFLSDAGGGSGTGEDWSGFNFIFDDAASLAFPVSGVQASGTFKPTCYGAFDGTLPGTPNYASTFGTSTFASVFGGIEPNGTWSLYIYDDATGDFGSINGWTLGIDINDPCLNNVASVPPTNGTTFEADYQCVDANEPNFINYFDDAGTPGNNTDDYILMSIDKLTNPDIGEVGDGTFSVQISGAPGATWITNPPADYVIDPLFIVMNRWWNVTPNCATCASSPNIDADANVRFYFTQQDFDDVVSELIAGGAAPLDIAQSAGELYMYKINDLPGPYDANPANAHSGVPQAFGYNEDGYWEYEPGGASSDLTWGPVVNDYTGSDYGAEITVVAFSGGGGGGGSNGSGALPIELLYFTGHAEAQVNVIEWATASEKNNQHQIVERSANGLNNWSEIGRKAGAGTSTQTISYKLLDESPLISGYYRLRAVDFDGQEQLSEVIFIQRSADELAIVNAYPVPVAKNLTLTVNAPFSGDVIVRLSDISGKLISEKTYAAVKGLNTLDLEMAFLAAGTYQVTVTDGTTRIINHVVKQ
jgi:hypothetical protein